MEDNYIDLDKIAERTLAIKLNDEKLELKQPTWADFKAISEYEADASDTFDGMLKIVSRMLNNNASGKKFKDDEIKAMPQTVLRAIYKGVYKFALEIMNDPNC